MKNDSLTVIIPTAGVATRRNSLIRAVDSCLKQEGVSIEVKVVVNGENYYQQIFEDIDNMEGVKHLYLAEGGLPGAIELGRKSVESGFFCFLDDDDEFIKNSLKHPLKVLRDTSSIDIVAFNGVKFFEGKEEKKKYFEKFPLAQADPVESFKKGVWLASCGAVYRNDSIEYELFEKIYKYYEWTSIALRISLKKKIYFLDFPVFIVNASENSLSNSSEYKSREIQFVESILSYQEYPKTIKNIYREKLCNLLNQRANEALDNEKKWSALQYYVRCIAIFPQGLKYFLWGRFLLGLKRKNYGK